MKVSLKKYRFEDEDEDYEKEYELSDMDMEIITDILEEESDEYDDYDCNKEYYDEDEDCEDYDEEPVPKPTTEEKVIDLLKGGFEKRCGLSLDEFMETYHKLLEHSPERLI